MFIRLKHTSHKWFWAASVLLALFLVYTIVFATGVLQLPTLQLEQLLLQRPITRVDCVLLAWGRIGEADFSLLFTLILAIGCVLLGYRRRVLPYVLLLFLLVVGIEYAGKQVFPQPVPDNLRSGLDSLDCPQIYNQPMQVKVLVAMGLWWEAPTIPPERLLLAQQSATSAFTFNDAPPDYGYPSGHAIRWCFIGLIVCWLVWRHMRRRRLALLRGLLMALALVVAFGGGFAQFYLGFHLSTDLISGYLLGLSVACCAIGILRQNEKQKRNRSNAMVDPTMDSLSRGFLRNIVGQPLRSL